MLLLDFFEVIILELFIKMEYSLTDALSKGAKDNLHSLFRPSRNSLKGIWSDKALRSFLDLELPSTKKGAIFLRLRTPGHARRFAPEALHFESVQKPQW